MVIVLKADVMGRKKEKDQGDGGWEGPFIYASARIPMTTTRPNACRLRSLFRRVFVLTASVGYKQSEGHRRRVWWNRLG